MKGARLPSQGSSEDAPLGVSLQASFPQLALPLYHCSLLNLFIGLFFRKKTVVS